MPIHYMPVHNLRIEYRAVMNHHAFHANNGDSPQLRTGINWIAVLCLSLFIAPPSTHAVEFDPFYTSGLVLQAGATNPIRGSGTPRETITVTFADQRQTCKVNSAGTWAAKLDPLPASFTPTTITATGSTSGEATCEDVLVGDVWLLAGQSNLSFPLRNAVGGNDAAEDAPGYPALRLLLFEPAVSMSAKPWSEATSPTSFFKPARWHRATKDASEAFSAVGFFFGRYLQYTNNVPVGLVQVAVGGTPIEAWLPRFDVERNPLLQSLAQDFPFSPLAHDFVSARSRANLGLDWERDLGTRGTNLNHPFAPGFMFDAAIKPLAGVPFAGIIWYQGESNAHDGDAYTRMFKLLLRSWRKTLGRPDPSILLVQLPELNRREWPEFRAAQQAIADENADVTLVPAIGLGNTTDVHPRRKRELGERLARQTPPPSIKKITVGANGAVTLVVEHAQGGLHLQGLAPVALAGRDKVFHLADSVELDGTNIIARSARVPRPSAVRYAWDATPHALVLRNRDDTPVLPYRSDEWPSIRIACCGDSITQGIGLSRTYPQALSDALGPLFDVRNFGRSGATVQSSIVRGWRRGYKGLEEFHRSLAFEPNVVILNLGINDSTKGTFDRQTFTREYIAIVRAYQALKNKPKVLLWAPLAPLFPGQTYYDHPVGQTIHAAIADVALATGATRIDMRSDLGDLAHHFPDNLHPNTDGATAIADITTRALDRDNLPVPSLEPIQP
jgi:lysophospholipase L1-like esterase